MATKIKTSNYSEEWYHSYHRCCKCGTAFMSSCHNYCPGCGHPVEEEIMCDREEMEGYGLEESEG